MVKKMDFIMKPDLLFFDFSTAKALNNQGHTLLTTMACWTNAFDFSYSNKLYGPCLSQTLINNPKSGIIGYLGSSRQGWFSSDPPYALTYSLSYEKLFYKRLLYPYLKPAVKHFGDLIHFIKRDHLGLVESDIYYKWLHFSLNGIGDPEMPIFNTVPYEFHTATAQYDDDGLLSVNAGVDDAKICVSTKGSESGYYRIGDSKSNVFDTGYGTFDVWITKQNYVPKHFEVKHFLKRIDDIDSLIIIEKPTAEIISAYPNPVEDILTVKYKIYKETNGINLSLVSVDCGQGWLFTIPKEGEEIELNLSGFASGMYILNLIEGPTCCSNQIKIIKR